MILNKAFVVVVIVVVALTAQRSRWQSETKNGRSAIVYKYYYNLQILCIFLGNSHTHTHAHINKLPTTMTAGNKQKQLLNEWSEWQKEEGKREEVKVKGETRGWCWSSIEISFN